MNEIHILSSTVQLAEKCMHIPSDKPQYANPCCSSSNLYDTAKEEVSGVTDILSNNTATQQLINKPS